MPESEDAVEIMIAALVVLLCAATYAFYRLTAALQDPMAPGAYLYVRWSAITHAMLTRRRVPFAYLKQITASTPWN